MPQFGFGFGFGFRKGVDNKTFISTWKTDNTGTSNDNQITLPLLSSGTYDFTVDWGDGNTDTITAYDDAAVTHTYASAGTYTVSISGTCDGFSFNNGGDKDKITGISNWGSLGLGNGTSGQHFRDATNLDITATDAPDLSNCTGLQFTFRNIGSFTGSMAGWDLSTITAAQYMAAYSVNFNPSGFNTALLTLTSLYSCGAMLDYCSAFDQDLTNFDITGLASNQLFGFGRNLGISPAQYSAFLIALEAQAASANVHSLAMDNVEYDASGAAARASLISTYGWTITDGGQV